MHGTILRSWAIAGLLCVPALRAPLAAQSGWDQYKPGSLLEISRQVQLDLPPDDTTGQGIVLAQSTFPTIAVLRYTGEFRPLSPENDRVLRGWQKAFGRPPEVLEHFKQEVRVTEDESEFWIPIQEGLIPQLKHEVAPGELVKLLTMWVGGDRSGAQIRSVFAANEFDTEVLFRSFDLGAHGTVELGKPFPARAILVSDTAGMLRLAEGTFANTDAIKVRLASDTTIAMHFRYDDASQFEAYVESAVSQFGAPLDRAPEAVSVDRPKNQYRWWDHATEMILALWSRDGRSWITLELRHRVVK